MLRMVNPNQLYIEDFKLQFGGNLRADNRWVILSKHMPWDRIEEIYARNFSKNSGAIGIPSRIAFGAIFAKEHEEWTDRETVQNIMENPYLQYFLGFSEFISKAPFDASMMVHFRKRFPTEAINEINELIFDCAAREALERKGRGPSGPPPNASKKATFRSVIEAAKEAISGSDPQADMDAEPTNQLPENAESPVINGRKALKNKGKLILDATCAPADIRYPTDISLLNEARENTEEIIDILQPLQPLNRAQRRQQLKDRKKARGKFRSITKQRSPGKRKIMAAIGNQLKYIWKNIELIGSIMLNHGTGALEEKHLQRIMTVCELYRQQSYMWQTKTHVCENRIVSLRQPHIRPIIRGKAGTPYEFGQKITLSVVCGYTFIEEQSFENINEGATLIESVERYKQRFGFYPEAVLADQIYRNKNNIKYCKERGIRLSGPPLGRPKEQDKANNESQAYRDYCERNIVEGRIGISKRRFGLDLIMCYLPETAQTEAALQIMCANFSVWMKSFFAFFIQSLLHIFASKTKIMCF